GGEAEAVIQHLCALSGFHSLLNAPVTFWTPECPNHALLLQGSQLSPKKARLHGTRPSLYSSLNKALVQTGPSGSLHSPRALWLLRLSLSL
uniref:Uncharacterized protein n=1 Tax=Calidris pygmaea TaxID=425635 RepID=A0A8C3JJE2_9CHAR